MQNKSENVNFHVGLKIILKNKKGEILGLKMPDSSSMKGYYDLLGGRIGEEELKKPFEEIIRREIVEEIGPDVKYTLNEIPVAIARHSYFSRLLQKDQYIFWVFFEAVYKGGGIKISSEHKEYSLLKVNKKNLKKYFVRGLLEGMTHYVFKKFPNNPNK